MIFLKYWCISTSIYIPVIFQVASLLAVFTYPGHRVIIDIRECIKFCLSTAIFSIVLFYFFIKIIVNCVIYLIIWH
ncbi:hypothetical protein EAE89_02585 [Photorhabdus heterorhabditis]|nr:hypothetical protein [Photorhabdus heterorhabditis]